MPKRRNRLINAVRKIAAKELKRQHRGVATHDKAYEDNDKRATDASRAAYILRDRLRNETLSDEDRDYIFLGVPKYFDESKKRIKISEVHRTIARRKKKQLDATREDRKSVV